MIASTIAISVASTTMPGSAAEPEDATVAVTLLIEAETTVVIVFSARVAATEIETAAIPTDTAMDTATAAALMAEVSVASTLMRPAVIPTSDPLTSPSINARTLPPIVFVICTPAPVRATPTLPAAMATDPATTIAPMLWSADAVTERSPPAVTLELTIFAVMAAVASIMLFASATPIETAIPAAPTPTAPDAETIVAVILADDDASTETLSTLLTVLDSM